MKFCPLPSVLLLSLCRFSMAGEGDPAPITPLAADSHWELLQEGSTGKSVRAGRTAGRFLIESGGTGILQREDAGIGQKSQYPTRQRLSARLVSVSGPAGAEAGIALEGPGNSEPPPVGARAAWRTDGTLRISRRSYETQNIPDVVLTGLSLPLWLRMDDLLNVDYSQDGTHWKTTGQAPMTFPPAEFRLLCASGTASTGKEAAAAVFDQVQLLGGDADDNQLPDGWEMFWFGRLGQEAKADPDGDTLSNSALVTF